MNCKKHPDVEINYGGCEAACTSASAAERTRAATVALSESIRRRGNRNAFPSVRRSVTSVRRTTSDEIDRLSP
jgi:hypothetical protein